jgi:1-aminocyclopropane-1-carboxylate deaminase/D-cysteine desulfhydrase-like pyridoxal-dependent ACC family enzyme
MTLIYKNTTIQELKSQLFEQKRLQILVKREDQNHPFVSGNKWWKLKYNLEEAIRLKHHTLLTFGGAYSNHIYGAAAAGRELGLKTIGVIRGEETLPLNHTLSFAKNGGMYLHYVSREAYRKKSEPEFIKSLADRFGDFYLIPEGGTNLLAIKGCSEFAKQLNTEIDFDYLCLAVGTGGTIAGVIEGLDSSKNIIGFSALKGGTFLMDDIRKSLTTDHHNWTLQADYHFGGYAKSTEQLLKFIQEMKGEYHLPLDEVYTAKMLWGVVDLVQKDYFKEGSTILILHTGGLQNKYE